MIRVLIIDDENLSRLTIRTILTENFNNIEICGEADSVQSGYDVICSTNPDLVFLDIKMSDGTGLNLLSRFTELTFDVIFVTGFDEYAIKAIKLSALDYILKPVNPFEVIEAINKYIRKNSEKTVPISNASQYDIVFRNVNAKPKKISLRTGEQILFVDPSEIIRCQSESNYTNFHFTSKKKLLVSKTLRDYERMLDGYGFLRVHQSHLVNLFYVDRYEKSSGGYLVLKDNSQIPVSPKLKERLLNILENH